ncbi:MAG TPA: hypothetical protein VIF43_04235 [Patescibacteria group bacterium]|jgi:hypothetical protein
MTPEEPIPDDARTDAETEAKAAAEQEQRKSLHGQGSLLVTDIDPDQGGLDMIVYRKRRYPFRGDGVIEIGRTRSQASEDDRVSIAVLDAGGRQSGRLAVFKHPEGILDAEVDGLTLEELVELEKAMRTLRPKDVLPEGG